MIASAADLEVLYRERWVGFKRALSTLTGDYAEAEEVLQEAFVRALRRLPQFRSEAPLAAWVWRIAVNVLNERRRRRAREQPAASMPSDDAHLIEQGHESWLVEGLAALPPRRRLIVFLRYFADCSYAEIAAMCEISEGTVGAALAQARKELEQAYASGFAVGRAGGEER